NNNDVPNIVTDSHRRSLFRRLILPLLFFLCLISVWTLPVLGQKIDIQLNDAPFRTVIKELQKKQPDYSFSINERHLKQAKPVSLNLFEVEFVEVLARIFQNQPFSYKVDGKQIVSIDRQTG